jgi:hypothetical protein
LITLPQLRKQLETTVIGCQPNKDLVRQHLQSGQAVPGAVLVKGEHVRFD